MNISHYITAIICVNLCLLTSTLQVSAQDSRRPKPERNVITVPEERNTLAADSIVQSAPDSLAAKAFGDSLAIADTAKVRHKRNWATWKPEAKRALWLALVLPGAGQIYNRKYWKLPIFYGGFVGCAYAMRWNNMMYRDYSQAYLDIMDNDPNTQSYNQFLHLGTEVTSENQSRYQDLFRRRKDRYRRWRDLSFFVMIGVYALSVIDAYVDASLSEFDISPDLSLHVSPAIINGSTGGGGYANPFKTSGLGMQCAITF